MGDMGDYWRDVRPGMLERSKAKRADNREQSAAILTAAGVRYEAHNAGAHLIVTHGSHTYDFWPGTGLWKMRGSVQQRRGVRAMLKQIGVAFPNLRTSDTAGSGNATTEGDAQCKEAGKT